MLLDRPHVTAAAFSRGGIAWRIAVEVLGLEAAIDVVLDTYPDQVAPVSMEGRRTYWYHAPDEGEWFYLVGGYELLTG